MVVAIFGESCTGKSTLAALLKGPLKAEVFTGKDYLRLAKSETAAGKLFREKLEAAVTGGFPLLKDIDLGTAPTRHFLTPRPENIAKTKETGGQPRPPVFSCSR